MAEQRQPAHIVSGHASVFRCPARQNLIAMHCGMGYKHDKTTHVVKKL